MLVAESTKPTSHKLVSNEGLFGVRNIEHAKKHILNFGVKFLSRHARETSVWARSFTAKCQFIDCSKESGKNYVDNAKAKVWATVRVAMWTSSFARFSQDCVAVTSTRAHLPG
jgi:hypothetical protein